MWFQLALNLGGRTVADWQATMTPREFARWGDFFRVQPFDDYHRFHRPAALIASAMAGGDVRKMLDWLQPDREDEMSDADEATMRAFGFTRKGG